MDKLSITEQAELKNGSSERLTCQLIKAGWAEETVLAMDRQAQLNNAAELKLNPVGATTGFIKPAAIWEEELELRRAELLAKEEERKMEAEFRAAEIMRHEEMRAAEELHWRTGNAISRG